MFLTSLFYDSLPTEVFFLTYLEIYFASKTTHSQEIWAQVNNKIITKKEKSKEL